MCGRYASTQTDADLLHLFEVIDAVDDELPARYNIAPTDPVRTVLARAEPDETVVRQLRTARWGLVPSWSKDARSGARLINARSETVTERPAFKAAAARRRCLVPADGYYEWERRDGAKIPHYLHGDGPLAFAGLYELWRDRTDPDAEWLWSVTILTAPAADSLGHIHDRSPVIMPKDLHDDWLDPTATDPGGVRDLLASVPEPHLEPRLVSTRVNNVRHDGPDLVQPR